MEGEGRTTLFSSLAAIDVEVVVAVLSAGGVVDEALPALLLVRPPAVDAPATVVEDCVALVAQELPQRSLGEPAVLLELGVVAVVGAPGNSLLLLVHRPPTHPSTNDV